jgi:type II secretory pathway component GspD/PulD (secretin)
MFRATVLAALAVSILLMAAPSMAQTHRTDIIFLKSMSVSRAAALYERVIGFGVGGRLVPGRDGRSLIVHDLKERLERFRRFLELLDVEGRGEFKIFVRPVQHVVPSELANIVAEVFYDDERRGVVLVPDDRTRLLIVQSTTDTYHKIDNLIRNLDVPLPRKKSIRVAPAPADTAK